MMDELGDRRLRSWSRIRKGPRDDESRLEDVFVSIFVLIVFAAGVASAVYLLNDALHLLFLAVVFGFNAPPTPVLGYLEFVAKHSIPAVCFAAIGIAGLLLWPSERFWRLGLAAILAEVALAIYDIANPQSMLILSLVPK